MNKTIFKEKCVEILCVIVISLILLWIISSGNRNFGLYDDNQTQWLPIIDSAYSELFRSGHFPVYDWYQMKGMIIYDQGYYGLWNPFMLIAYIINTYILGWFGSNTITIYIVLMVVLGNLCSYSLFRQGRIIRLWALLGSQFLCVATVYTYLAYWYYVFNVYFILTWLLLAISKYKESKSYYCHGLILALSVLMGNIQYTVYMCLAYAIIMLFLGFHQEKRNWLRLCTNVMVMGILSSCYLLMLLKVSARSADFVGNNSAYYDMSVNPLWFLIFSFIPSELIGNEKEWIAGLFQNLIIPGAGGVDDFPKTASMFMGVEVFCCILFWLKRKKYKKDRSFHIAQAGLLCAVILLVLSFGEIGLLAVIVEEVPMWNSFRILSKFLVLLPPLLLPASVLGFRFIVKSNKWLQIGVLLLFTAGIIQARVGSVGAEAIELVETRDMLQKVQVDIKHYRVAGFSSYEEISYQGDWKEFQQKDFINLSEKISKNAGTVAGIFTLGGYDLAFDENRFKLSDAMMQSKSGYASEFGYDNLVIGDYFWNYMEPTNLEYEVRVQRWSEQVKNNAVKYFIFTKESSDTDKFEQLVNKAGMEIEWSKEFMNHTCIISLRDIPALIVSGEGEKLNFESTIDRMEIPYTGSEKLYLSFAFDSNIHAYLKTKEGARQDIKVKEDEKGYVVLENVQMKKDDVIVVEYRNRLFEFAKIWTGIVVLMFVLGFAVPEFSVSNKVLTVSQKKIKIPEEKVNKVVWGVFIITGILYCMFLGNLYIRTQVLSADEIWFLHMFQTIHHKIVENPFACLGETENYLGYGQIYWMLGGLVSNMFILRGIAFLSLIGSCILMLSYVEKTFGRYYVPYAGLLWITMPFAWFSNKIIGPELIGLFVSVLGFYCITVKGVKKEWIGWMLLGVGCAIKANYAVFVLVAICQITEWRELRNRVEWKKICQRLCMLGAGFLIANPIILMDFGTFLENGRTASGISMDMLTEVMGRKYIEWDGVMVNGFFYGYLHWIMVLLITAGCIFKGIRDKKTISFLLCGCMLIYICARTSFLGWYMLPMLFLIPALVSGIWKEHVDKSGTGGICLLILILMNAVLLMPVHLQERKNDIKHIEMLDEREKNLQQITLQQETLRSAYNGEKIFYLTEFNYGSESYNFYDYYNFCIVREAGIAFVGERMQNVPIIKQMIEDAKNSREYLEVIETIGDIMVIRRHYG